MRGNAEQAAVSTWQRALTMAQAAPPRAGGPVERIDASTVARSLAAVLRKLGLHASAQSLIDQADELDDRARTAGNASAISSRSGRAPEESRVRVGLTVEEHERAATVIVKAPTVEDVTV